MPVLQEFPSSVNASWIGSVAAEMAANVDDADVDGGSLVGEFLLVHPSSAGKLSGSVIQTLILIQRLRLRYVH